MTATIRGDVPDHAAMRATFDGAHQALRGLSPDPVSGEGFSDVLLQAVQRTNDMQVDAGDRQQRLAAGLTDDLHGTMIASQEATISMHLLGSIRNKLLDAYHELWRTSV